MKRRRLGSTDVELSSIGLGGAWLGHDPADPSDAARALEVMQAVDECGVNWLDTSENYFDTGNESVIGQALREMPNEFLICSKAAPGAVHSGAGSGFRPEQIRQACTGSLRRLRRDHIDVYLLHWPDDTGVPLADTWGAMAALADEGYVRSIGLSNYDQEDIAACHRQRAVDVIQDGLNVIDYLDDRNKFAWCGKHGIAVTIYEPLAGGLLTDKPFEQVRQRWIGTAWENLTVYPELLCEENAPAVGRVVDGLRTIGQAMDASIADVAIAWLLAQPGVTSAIVGSANPERARVNARSADVTLSDDDLRFIDDQLIPLGPTFIDRGPTDD